MNKTRTLRLLFLSVVFLTGLFSFVHKNETNSPVVLSENQWIESQLSRMTLKEKIGQFFMVAAYSNRGEAHLASIDSLISNNKIGGLIFFQGERENLISSVDRFQKKSEVPLLIGMDAEWGTQMRLFGEDRFPYNYTVGAADDFKLTEEIAAMIGQECREMGIHMNFAPVADVNSNPNNPVIGFRSFGENPSKVGGHVAAAVRGMENQGVLTSVKHFPGHGDTDTDSHLDLPIVNNDLSHIDAIDFSPFRAGIKAGTSSIMVGHLNVPALDSTGTPSSLSAPTIKGYLQGKLGFKGLVISDALNMKAVADRYGKTDVVVKAFEAGCDILLFPESVGDAIQAIENKVAAGDISEEELNQRCKKVLKAKYNAIINPKQLKKYNEFDLQLTKRKLYESAITVLKNNEVFPIQRFDQKIARVSIGSSAYSLKNSMDLVTPIDHFHFYTVKEAQERLKDTLSDYDIIITTLHSNTVRSRNNYGLPEGWKEWLNELPSAKKALVLFGNPLALADFDDSNLDAVIVGYENHPILHDRMGQFLMGTFESKGKLPMTVNSKYPREAGLKVQWSGRLKESQPEELGISRDKLMEIDRIVNEGIAAEAFPGCQIVVAVEGKVIWRKSYGYHTYDKKRPVRDDDVYDIASITKIASSTASLMKLNSEGKFSLDNRLVNYLPELTQGTGYSNIRLRDMMSHQAGLVAWIPFYKATLDGYRPSEQWYSTEMDSVHQNQVTGNLFMKADYTDSIYSRILSTPLKSRKYKYSDLGYYFVRKIVQEQSGKTLDEFTMDEFYRPMGLKYMRYKPLDYFPKWKITPTENDTIFRKELIHGYVHDPGAAMIGGVGGHAGLFSNAGDLAALMQLFLNEGNYGGVQYIKPSVVNEYTNCQYCPKNRRGAGFDKPTTNRRGGPTTSLASLKSFGHSGFTGTLAWADPVNDVNYVFLSNRVYPDAENWKIVSMNTRTEIQRVIYEAVNSAKK